MGVMVVEDKADGLVCSINARVTNNLERGRAHKVDGACLGDPP